MNAPSSSFFTDLNPPLWSSSLTLSADGALSIALMSEKAGDRTAWVHLVPAGSSIGVDGRGPYVLRNPDAVIARTREFHGQKQMMVDYGHQSFYQKENGKPALAAGWVVGLEARENGIWGLVEWTETAAAHIAKREFRYVSPALHVAPDGTIAFINNVGLVNTPNLDQLVALNSAEDTMDNPEIADKVREAAALLGLPDTSDQTAVISRLKQVMQIATALAEVTGDTGIAQQSAAPDPAKFVPIGDFQRTVAELNKLRSGMTKEKAELHVADHIRAGIILPYMKDWAVSLCTTNMNAYDDFVSGVGPGFSNLLATSGATAAAPGKTSLHSASAELSQAELAVCKNMGLTAEQYLSTRGTSAKNME